MTENGSPRISSFFPTTLFLTAVGWGGLYILLNFTQPYLGPRWLLFVLIVMACTGTALPLVAFLNRRFPTTPPAAPSVVTREALWFGIYFATLAWLRIPRVLTPTLAFLLLVGLILIEWLLRLRERSQWKP